MQTSCSVAPLRPPAVPDPVKTAARSLSIVRSATAQNPRVLKILFYGQSISTPKWTDQAMAALRAHYPDVTFDVRNLALGGWASQLLERAAQRDVEDFYPDLIVFHVYGDHRAYERIIRTFRSRTAADIIVQTDHVVVPVEPLCDEGFHLRWSPPPGCTGHVRFKQNSWEEFMSGNWIPTMAAKYDLSLEPRRQRWARYLTAHDLKPAVLLADPPHPNGKGWALMAHLFTSWFETLVARSAGVQPLHPDAEHSFSPPAPGETRQYTFEGNRIELLAAGPLDGMISAKIDGKPAQTFDGCWQQTRTSRLPNLPDWPALKQVQVRADDHRADRWTLSVHQLDVAQKKFAFTLESDRTGPDGSGTSDQPFTSSSRRVTIQPEDWNLAYARQVAGKGVAEGASFGWERRFVCTDQQPLSLAGGRIEQRHVVATGLANSRHVVELTLARTSPKISEVRTYRPPLTQ